MSDYQDWMLDERVMAEFDRLRAEVERLRRALSSLVSVDEHGNCLGCGRKAEHVAEGAADDCPVCLAFLVRYAR